MPYTYTYGSGTEGDPYQVWTANDLDGVRDHLDKYFIQMADINLGVSPWNENEGWVPIGDGNSDNIEDMFRGEYDQNNFTISGLTINRPSEWHQGLFGRMWKSKYINFNVINASVNGLGNVSIICGRLTGIYVTATKTYAHFENGYVEGISKGARTVGDIIGITFDIDLNEGVKIYNCHTDVNIIIDKTYYTEVYSIGGIIGSGEHTNIQECSSKGTISMEDSLDAEYVYYIGGIAGYLGGSASNTENSYSRKNFENIYATGAGYIDSIGGCFGYFLTNNNTTKNCYSTGSIPLSGATIGGFMGNYVSGTITNCYYDSETSGQSDTGKGTPKTTAEMIYPYSDPDNVYIDWDFHTVWAHDKGGSA